MKIKIGTIFIPDEYVVGLAGLKNWDDAGVIIAAAYGFFIGSYGLGFCIEYDT